MRSAVLVHRLSWNSINLPASSGRHRDRDYVNRRVSAKTAFYAESDQSLSRGIRRRVLNWFAGKSRAGSESIRIGATNSLIIRFPRSKRSAVVYTRIWKVNLVVRRWSACVTMQMFAYSASRTRRLAQRVRNAAGAGRYSSREYRSCTYTYESSGRGGWSRKRCNNGEAECDKQLGLHSSSFLRFFPKLSN